MNLTQKQRRLIQNLLEPDCKSNRSAAIKAGYAPGSAGSTVCVLLQSPNFQKALELARSEYVKEQSDKPPDPDKLRTEQQQLKIKLDEAKLRQLEPDDEAEQIALARESYQAMLEHVFRLGATTHEEQGWPGIKDKLPLLLDEVEAWVIQTQGKGPRQG